MTDQKNAAKPKYNIFKKWWFWVPAAFIAFLLLFVWWLFSPSAVNPKSLVVDSGEQLVVGGVNYAITLSALDGSGEITNFDCHTLGNIAIRNGGNFFNDSECEPGSMGFIAKREETAQTNVITLYPNSTGTIVNCTDSIATFTFNTDQTELLSYTFVNGDCYRGAVLRISEVNVQTAQELSEYIDTNNYKRAK